MEPDEYVRSAAERMRADGSEVSEVMLGRFKATTGYRGQFRLRWFATKLHTFTVLVPIAVANEPDLRDLISLSRDYGRDAEGALRGLQTGVAVIPVLVAAAVAPPARALAEAVPARTALVFARPAIVDLSAGQTYTYAGRQLLGGIYNSWLRERLAVVTP